MNIIMFLLTLTLAKMKQKKEVATVRKKFKL